MSDHRAAFEAALKENPYDATTHFVFADWLEENGFDDEAAWQRSWTRERQEAEDWLKVYAARMNCYDDPEAAFNGLVEGLRTKELFAHGSDLHGLYDLHDAEDLREHARTYLGLEIDWNRFTFSCSC